jgi:hypothetical protein
VAKQRSLSEAKYQRIMRHLDKVITYLEVVRTGTIENAAHFTPIAKDEAEVVRRLLSEARER